MSLSPSPPNSHVGDSSKPSQDGQGSSSSNNPRATMRAAVTVASKFALKSQQSARHLFDDERSANSKRLVAGGGPTTHSSSHGNLAGGGSRSPQPTMSMRSGGGSAPSSMRDDGRPPAPPQTSSSSARNELSPPLTFDDNEVSAASWTLTPHLPTTDGMGGTRSMRMPSLLQHFEMQGDIFQSSGMMMNHLPSAFGGGDEANMIGIMMTSFESQAPPRLFAPPPPSAEGQDAKMFTVSGMQFNDLFGTSNVQDEGWMSRGASLTIDCPAMERRRSVQSTTGTEQLWAIGSRSHPQHQAVGSSAQLNALYGLFSFASLSAARCRETLAKVPPKPRRQSSVSFAQHLQSPGAPVPPPPPPPAEPTRSVPGSSTNDDRRGEETLQRFAESVIVLEAAFPSMAALWSLSVSKDATDRLPLLEERLTLTAQRLIAEHAVELEVDGRDERILTLPPESGPGGAASLPTVKVTASGGARRVVTNNGVVLAAWSHRKGAALYRRGLSVLTTAVRQLLLPSSFAVPFNLTIPVNGTLVTATWLCPLMRETAVVPERGSLLYDVLKQLTALLLGPPEVSRRTDPFAVEAFACVDGTMCLLPSPALLGSLQTARSECVLADAMADRLKNLRHGTNAVPHPPPPTAGASHGSPTNSVLSIDPDAESRSHDVRLRRVTTLFVRICSMLESEGAQHRGAGERGGGHPAAGPAGRSLRRVQINSSEEQQAQQQQQQQGSSSLIVSRLLAETTTLFRDVLHANGVAMRELLIVWESLNDILRTPNQKLTAVIVQSVERLMSSMLTEAVSRTLKSMILSSKTNIVETANKVLQKFLGSPKFARANLVPALTQKFRTVKPFEFDIRQLQVPEVIRFLSGRLGLPFNAGAKQFCVISPEALQPKQQNSSPNATESASLGVPTPPCVPWAITVSCTPIAHRKRSVGNLMSSEAEQFVQRIVQGSLFVSFCETIGPYLAHQASLGSKSTAHVRLGSADTAALLMCHHSTLATLCGSAIPLTQLNAIAAELYRVTDAISKVHTLTDFAGAALRSMASMRSGAVFQMQSSSDLATDSNNVSTMEENGDSGVRRISPHPPTSKRQVRIPRTIAERATLDIWILVQRLLHSHGFRQPRNSAGHHLGGMSSTAFPSIRFGGGGGAVGDTSLSMHEGSPLQPTLPTFPSSLTPAGLSNNNNNNKSNNSSQTAYPSGTIGGIISVRSEVYGGNNHNYSPILSHPSSSSISSSMSEQSPRGAMSWLTMRRRLGRVVVAPADRVLVCTLLESELLLMSASTSASFFSTSDEIQSLRLFLRDSAKIVLWASAACGSPISSPTNTATSLVHPHLDLYLHSNTLHQMYLYLSSAAAMRVWRCVGRHTMGDHTVLYDPIVRSIQRVVEVCHLPDVIGGMALCAAGSLTDAMQRAALMPKLATLGLGYFAHLFCNGHSSPHVSSSASDGHSHSAFHPPDSEGATNMNAPLPYPIDPLAQSTSSVALALLELFDSTIRDSFDFGSSTYYKDRSSFLQCSLENPIPLGSLLVCVVLQAPSILQWVHQQGIQDVLGVSEVTRRIELLQQQRREASLEVFRATREGKGVNETTNSSSEGDADANQLSPMLLLSEGSDEQWTLLLKSLLREQGNALPKYWVALRGVVEEILEEWDDGDNDDQKNAPIPTTTTTPDAKGRSRAIWRRRAMDTLTFCHAGLSLYWNVQGVSPPVHTLPIVRRNSGLPLLHLPPSNTTSQQQQQQQQQSRGNNNLRSNPLLDETPVTMNQIAGSGSAPPKPPIPRPLPPKATSPTDGEDNAAQSEEGSGSSNHNTNGGGRGPPMDDEGGQQLTDPTDDDGLLKPEIASADTGSTATDERRSSFPTMRRSSGETRAPMDMPRSTSDHSLQAAESEAFQLGSTVTKVFQSSTNPDTPQRSSQHPPPASGGPQAPPVDKPPLPARPSFPSTKSDPSMQEDANSNNGKEHDPVWLRRTSSQLHREAVGATTTTAAPPSSHTNEDDAAHQRAAWLSSVGNFSGEYGPQDAELSPHPPSGARHSQDSAPSWLRSEASGGVKDQEGATFHSFATSSTLSGSPAATGTSTSSNQNPPRPPLTPTPPRQSPARSSTSQGSLSRSHNQRNSSSVHLLSNDLNAAIPSPTAAEGGVSPRRSSPSVQHLALGSTTAHRLLTSDEEMSRNTAQLHRDEEFVAIEKKFVAACIGVLRHQPPPLPPPGGSEKRVSPSRRSIQTNANPVDSTGGASALRGPLARSLINAEQNARERLLSAELTVWSEIMRRFGARMNMFSSYGM